MDAALAITPATIQHVAREISPAPFSVHKMQEVTKYVREIVRVTEKLQHPEDFTAELVAVFSSFAQPFLEKPSILKAAHFGFVSARLMLKGETKTLAAFIEATYQLKTALLDALERSQLQYEQEKAECVRDALENWSERPALKPESFREWLDRVPNNPVR